MYGHDGLGFWREFTAFGGWAGVWGVLGFWVFGVLGFCGLGFWVVLGFSFFFFLCVCVFRVFVFWCLRFWGLGSFGVQGLVGGLGLRVACGDLMLILPSFVRP